MKKDLRLIFMGTPEFAVATLDALVQHGYNVVAVVTAPDKPAGRGQQVQQSAVKKYAMEHHIPVLQPEKLKSPEFLAELKSLRADVQVVVAFRMLPEAVWNMPALGTFNLHASLLPQYRGAAPINWAVINGETETGVTTFFLDKEIDTGKVIFSEKVRIGENETAGELHDRLMQTGSALVVKTVEKIAAGAIQTHPQESLMDAPLKHAPKIFKDDCRINWHEKTNSIHNKIRGLSPYPAAWTEWQQGTTVQGLKIYRSKKEAVTHTLEPGTIVSDNKNYLKVACADGFVYLDELQLAGKKRMPVTELLKGTKFNEHDKMISI